MIEFKKKLIRDINLGMVSVLDHIYFESSDKEIENISSIIEQIKKKEDEIDESKKKILKEMWKMEIIKKNHEKLIENSSKILKYLPFFLEKIDELLDHNYKLKNEDICRIDFGICETIKEKQFIFENNNKIDFVLPPLKLLKNEKIIGYFYRSIALIYVLPITSYFKCIDENNLTKKTFLLVMNRFKKERKYNIFLPKRLSLYLLKFLKGKTNMLDHHLKMIRKISNSNTFREKMLIVLLNEDQNFKSLLDKYPFKNYFPQFEGDQDNPSQILSFIQIIINQNETNKNRAVITFETSSLDENNAKKSLNVKKKKKNLVFYFENNFEMKKKGFEKDYI